MRPMNPVSILLIPMVLGAVVIASHARPAPPTPAWPMDTYVLGVLTRGPAWTPERTPRTDSLQASHMANIRRMADSGVLVGAGPMAGQGELRGLFIFRADSAAQVEPLLVGDGAIAADRLRCRLLTWWGPKGMGEDYRERKRRDPAARDSMVTYTFAFLRPGSRRAELMAGPKGRRLVDDHVRNITRLARGGSLIAGGPLDGDDAFSGVLVFAADTTEAKRLTATDPAVRAGLFRAEFHRWWVGHGVIPGH